METWWGAKAKKEEIYKWENCLINEWLIHRDVLYYMKQAYEKVNGTIKESHQVLALSLLIRQFSHL